MWRRRDTRVPLSTTKLAPPIAPLPLPRSRRRRQPHHLLGDSLTKKFIFLPIDGRFIRQNPTNGSKDTTKRSEPCGRATISASGLIRPSAHGEYIRLAPRKG